MILQIGIHVNSTEFQEQDPDPHIMLLTIIAFCTEPVPVIVIGVVYGMLDGRPEWERMNFDPLSSWRVIVRKLVASEKEECNLFAQSYSHWSWAAVQSQIMNIITDYLGEFERGYAIKFGDWGTANTVDTTTCTCWHCPWSIIEMGYRNWENSYW